MTRHIKPDFEMKPTAGLAATMSAKSATAWVGIDEIRAVIND
jgi:hypothetical protein